MYECKTCVTFVFEHTEYLKMISERLKEWNLGRLEHRKTGLKDWNFERLELRKTRLKDWKAWGLKYENVWKAT